jgi:hypothetical protein
MTDHCGELNPERDCGCARCLAARVRELEAEVERLKAEISHGAEHDFGPETDTHEDRGYSPRCNHDWGINGCKKCGRPAMSRGGS